MSTSEFLRNKLVLAVNEEKDVLEIIEEELAFAAINVTLHGATTFEHARQYLVSYTYDLVLLDIMGIGGFDLLQITQNACTPAVVLTAHMFTPETLNKSIELGARGHLPMEQLGSLIPFLEDILKHSCQSAWEKTLDQVGALFRKGLSPDWKKKQERIRAGFGQRLPVWPYCDHKVTQQ